MEMILAALTAGAAAGATNTASMAVQDTYTSLKDALRNRLASTGQAQQMLEGVESEPEVWQAELSQRLEESGAAYDSEIVASARRLLALIDSAGAPAHTYQVDLREAKAVQVGDHNTQQNHFA
ncbi:hypothetical protein [Paractinoplanes toevensis]|uniref:hypothetical protein n=1 Tax=Paractinoplanes toevensis TaxID=571911 RepID=UPI001BB34991|nr:hypothetical protein [Actinoplanes toevensis]